MPSKKPKLPKKAEVIKSLKDFVKDEDGFVSKETILKVGLSVAAGMATFSAISGAGADHSSHNNTVDVPVTTGCLEHTNNLIHTSY